MAADRAIEYSDIPEGYEIVEAPEAEFEYSDVPEGYEIIEAPETRFEYSDIPEGYEVIETPDIPETSGEEEPVMQEVPEFVSEAPEQVSPEFMEMENLDADPLVKTLTDSYYTVTDVAKVYPALETAATFMTSMYGLPLSGFAGLVALPFGADVAAKTVEKAQELMVYQPQTEAGERLTTATFYPFEKLAQAGGYLGEKTLEKTDSPLAAALVDAGIQTLPAALIPAVRSAKARGMAKQRATKVANQIKEALKRPELTEEELVSIGNNAIEMAIKGEKVVPQSLVDVLYKDEVRIGKLLSDREQLIKGIELGRRSGQETILLENDLARINSELENLNKLGRRTDELQQRLVEEQGDPTTGEFLNKEFERKFKEAQAVDAKTHLQRAFDWVKETASDFKKSLLREFKYLPRTGEYAPLRNELLRLQKQRAISSDKTLRIIKDITKDMSETEFDLFRRKVVLDDMYEDVAARIADFDQQRAHFPGESPVKEPTFWWDLSFDEIKAEWQNITKQSDVNTQVVNALARRAQSWEILKADYIKAMKDIGFDVTDRLTRDNYYRHLVLDYIYAKEGPFGTGKRLKTPTGRGYLRKRSPNMKAYSTDYLQAEHEVMAQMIHDIEVAKVIKFIKDEYNIKNRIVDDMLRNPNKYELPPNATTESIRSTLWKENIPEGYEIWQPRQGNLFYVTEAIPAQLAEKIFTETVNNGLNLPKDYIRKLVARGRKYEEYVVKKEIADTLNRLTRGNNNNGIKRWHDWAIRKWKVIQLISPKRWTKYNLRNLTGDADAVFAGNPKAFLKSGKAIRDLWDYYKNDKMSPELNDWYERGGTLTTLQAQEMGQLSKLKQFMEKQAAKGEALPAKTAVRFRNKYWNVARMSTDFRESVLRYASYLDYLEQIEKSKTGKPNNFGASNPSEIMALRSAKDKAFWLSNELLGAYDKIGEFGKAFRESVFPFWSWKEVNMRRYYRLLTNAFDDGRLSTVLGRKTLGIAANPITYYRLGKFALKASAVWGMLEAWNYMMFPELEEKLPDEIRNRPHIVLGRDDKGEIRYFSRLGALADALEWFGLDTPRKWVFDYFDNKKTPKEIGKEIIKEGAKQTLNNFVNGSVPFIKIAGETITRRALFPDATNPRMVRDRIEHALQPFPLLQDGYRNFVAKKPTAYKGKKTNWNRYIQEFAFSFVDPYASGYIDTMNKKREFQKSLGEGVEGFWLSSKGQALYNLKLAMRYQDDKLASYWLQEYVNRGGTERGLSQSLNMMEPLYGLNEDEREVFVASLTEQEMDALVRGYVFWHELLTGEDFSQLELEGEDNQLEEPVIEEPSEFMGEEAPIE